MPNTRKIIYEGKTYEAFELAEKHGIKPNTFIKRLQRGIPLKQALMKTIQHSEKPIIQDKDDFVFKYNLPERLKYSKLI